jgi:hypothetical protein
MASAKPIFRQLNHRIDALPQHRSISVYDAPLTSDNEQDRGHGSFALAESRNR